MSPTKENLPSVMERIASLESEDNIAEQIHALALHIQESGQERTELLEALRTSASRRSDSGSRVRVIAQRMLLETQRVEAEFLNRLAASEEKRDEARGRLLWQGNPWPAITELAHELGKDKAPLDDAFLGRFKTLVDNGFRVRGSSTPSDVLDSFLIALGPSTDFAASELQAIRWLLDAICETIVAEDRSVTQDAKRGCIRVLRSWCRDSDAGTRNLAAGALKPFGVALDRPACLCVDLDGVLVHFTDREKTGLFEIFKRRGIGEDDAKKYYSKTKKERPFSIDAMIDVVKRDEDRDLDEVQIEREFYQWVDRNLEVCEESIDVLSKWLREGYRLVILTEGDDDFQKYKIREAGIPCDAEGLEIRVVPDKQAKFEFLSQLPDEYYPVALIEDDPAMLDLVLDSISDAELNHAELTEGEVLTLRVDRPESPHFGEESEHGHIRFDNLDEVADWLHGMPQPSAPE